MQVADAKNTKRGFLFGAYCIVAAFGTYFCMYAFRKPFAAITDASDQSQSDAYTFAGYLAILWGHTWL